MNFTKSVTTYYLERNNAKKCGLVKKHYNYILMSNTINVLPFNMYNTISVLLSNIHNTISVLLYTLCRYFRLVFD